MPKKLNDLDISGNVGLSSNIGNLSRNLRNVGHIVFEGKSAKSKAARVTLGGLPAHGKWTYGSSHAPGELGALSDYLYLRRVDRWQYLGEMYSTSEG